MTTNNPALGLSDTESFTPGPWEIHPEGIWFDIFAQDGAVVSCEGINNEANARLIASAPELYEALKMWLAVNDGIEDYGLVQEEIDARNATRAALAKAVKP